MLKIEGLHDRPVPEGQSGQIVSRPTELVITQINSGVRGPNRVNIFVNGKFSLSLDIKQVIDYKVKVGKKLTELELQELHSASEFGKLYQRTLEWTLVRPRSVRETRDYLKRQQIKRNQTNRKRLHDQLKPLPEIQNATTQLVLDRLIERDFVNDEKFAEHYIENRFVKKGISTKRLRLELTKKGINQDLVGRLLEQSSRNEYDELMKMARKKVGHYDQPKLIAYLVRQGFEYQDVVEVVAKISANE